ncbi:hypothetical protein FVEN_g12765 [Fusarium venenatum]|uniref:Uncharacterized protein n=1 Tax=Fusarium venenatum TaxID=56646 RepID=A0A2L2T5N5_9HYPO|nr:uncharacterized protein FVRRES_02636 [Fusarium venenatum]KAG8357994.1 hypothetical protein FVEN_g12765 [Fusarium venenatum]CEI66124.1 unnamed protein product [Fusarium venenatum]
MMKVALAFLIISYTYCELTAHCVSCTTRVWDPSDVRNGLSQEYKAWREAKGHEASEHEESAKASLSFSTPVPPKRGANCLASAERIGDSSWAPKNQGA